MQKVSFICTTYKRFKCVRRVLSMFYAQSHPDKEIVIFNTDTDNPYTKDFEDPNVIIVNNGTDYVTGLPYTNRGQICRDAVTHATGDFFMLADDDDIYLPWHMKQAVEGIEEIQKDAWKPEASLWSSPGHIDIVCNILEASIIVRMPRIREIGFNIERTGYEGLQWYDHLRDTGHLNEHNKNYVPSYCFNWGDPGDWAGHKQSGDIDNPDNFENHKRASTDPAAGPLRRNDDEFRNDAYARFYEWFRNNKHRLNTEYYNRYARSYVEN
jgi:glycosyltransferase involved in cell wall biosynthesis